MRYFHLLFAALIAIVHGYVVTSLQSLPCRYARALNGVRIKPIYSPTYRDFRASKSALHSSNSIDAPNSKVLSKWNSIVLEFKRRPWSYLSIPLVAAIVGYITNYLGVKMLFYPIKWLGVPIYRWKNQPFGVLGWQGIVPTKRVAMANKLVEVTISRLITVQEVFSRLSSTKMAEYLTPTVKDSILRGTVPDTVLSFFLRRTSKDMIKNIDKVVDVRDIVVTGLTSDPRVMGNFFQKVGKKELSFLIESGFGFGFLLGLLQMIQWIFYPKNWTLPVGGAVVGYITNWIALKWIFEPLYPTKVLGGTFIIQGMFLRRQQEVSQLFSEYIADNVLTSQKIWEGILEGSKCEEFRKIVSRNVPLPPGTMTSVITQLKRLVGRGVGSSSHPLHAYTDATLDLKRTLIERMGRLTPAEFEQVLHPIFQEDELTLILAGGVLGALAGGLQWWINVMLDKREEWKKNEKAREEQEQSAATSITGDDEQQQQPAQLA